MTVGGEAAVVIAGLAALAAVWCFVALRRMERRLALFETAMRGHVEALGDAVRMMEARWAESVAAAATTGAAGPSSSVEDADAACGESVDADLAPEIQAAIAAAGAVAMGGRARVSSIRLLNGPGDGDAWSRQGRVLVQSSHNVRPAR